VQVICECVECVWGRAAHRRTLGSCSKLAPLSKLGKAPGGDEEQGVVLHAESDVNCALSIMAGSMLVVLVPVARGLADASGLSHSRTDSELAPLPTAAAAVVCRNFLRVRERFQVGTRHIRWRWMQPAQVGRVQFVLETCVE
jgi:hypothetical protein